MNTTERLFTIAVPAHRRTIESQGCSMNLTGDEPVTGFMVSLRGREKRVPVLDFTAGHVDSFIRANLDLLHNHKVYVGTWISGDDVVIDCSLNMQNKRAALAFAQGNGQLAIYDVINKKCIEL